MSEHTVPVEIPGWLIRRAIAAAKTCPPERDCVIAATSLSFNEAFDLVRIVLEAAADVAIDSPEALER